MAAALCGLVAVQIALGALTVLSRKDVAWTTAHVAVGALVLGSALVLALTSRRVARRTAVAAELPRPAVEDRLPRLGVAAWK
jgi:heme A synthase